MEKIVLSFPYDLLSTVERLITEIPLEVEKRDYQTNCKVIAYIKKDLLPRFNQAITDLYTLEVEVL